MRMKEEEEEVTRGEDRLLHGESLLYTLPYITKSKQAKRMEKVLCI